MRQRMENFSPRLYIISPPKLDPVTFAPTMVKALDAGDVAAFQLRLEGASDIDILRCCEFLMPIAHERDVAFIINDRADLAKRIKCDGIHLGAQDLDIKQARQLLGVDTIIGASCHDSKHLAMIAAEKGADYVSFGPFYQSRTPFYPPEQYNPAKMVNPDLISLWQEIAEIPCVAAGGIKPDGCPDLVEAGADFICASTSIWEYPFGAAKAVRAFNDNIAYAIKKMAGPDIVFK